MQTFTWNLNPIVTRERERKKANTAPGSHSGRLTNSDQSNHTAIEYFTTLNPAVTYLVTKKLFKIASKCEKKNLKK